MVKSKHKNGTRAAVSLALLVALVGGTWYANREDSNPSNPIEITTTVPTPIFTSVTTPNIYDADKGFIIPGNKVEAITTQELKLNIENSFEDELRRENAINNPLLMEIILEKGQRYGGDPNVVYAFFLVTGNVNMGLSLTDDVYSFYSYDDNGRYTKKERVTDYDLLKSNPFDSNYYSIDIFCRKFQKSLIAFDYDLEKAIAAYFLGDKGLRDVLKVLEERGYDTSEKGSLSHHLSSLGYEEAANFVDSVLKYIPNDTTLQFKRVDADNNEVIDYGIKYSNHTIVPEIDHDSFGHGR